MTKAVFATFDGKAFVPDVPTDLPIGTKAAFDVEIEGDRPERDSRSADALENLLTPEQADEMLAIIEQRFGRVDPPVRGTDS